MQTLEAPAPPPVSHNVSRRTRTVARGESWPDEDWILRIHHVTNSGAAFGILQGQTGFLIVMALVGLVAIYLYYRNPPFDHWIASVAIGMMLGGAIGNLIDRVRFGRVTDYVDFLSYPSFNVADASISIGIAVLVIGFLIFGEHRQPVAPAASNEEA
jgi:signal peptidase II